MVGGCSHPLVPRQAFIGVLLQTLSVSTSNHTDAAQQPKPWNSLPLCLSHQTSVFYIPIVKKETYLKCQRKIYINWECMLCNHKSFGMKWKPNCVE